jgi:hypothetical protein
VRLGGAESSPKNSIHRPMESREEKDRQRAMDTELMQSCRWHNQQRKAQTNSGPVPELGVQVRASGPAGGSGPIS